MKHIITTISIDIKQIFILPDLYCEGDVNIGLRSGGVNNGTPFARHTQHAPLTLRWGNYRVTNQPSIPIVTIHNRDM